MKKQVNPFVVMAIVCGIGWGTVWWMSENLKPLRIKTKLTAHLTIETFNVENYLKAHDILAIADLPKGPRYLELVDGFVEQCTAFECQGIADFIDMKDCKQETSYDCKDEWTDYLENELPEVRP